MTAVSPKHQVVYWPDKRLTEKCEEVEKGTDVREIVQAMRSTMAIDRGIGLAACQIGVMSRIIVGHTDSWDFVLINPTIKKVSIQTMWFDEGCLSFPKTCDLYSKDGQRLVRKARRLRVRRYKQISMRGFNENWEPVTVKGRGLLGVCLQHEFDHLNGITLASHADERAKYFIT